MKITIRQILSVMDKNQFVSIYGGESEEFFGTAEECQSLLPYCVLDTTALRIYACSVSGKAIIFIYKEASDEQ